MEWVFRDTNGRPGLNPAQLDLQPFEKGVLVYNERSLLPGAWQIGVWAEGMAAQGPAVGGDPLFQTYTGFWKKVKEVAQAFLNLCETLAGVREHRE